MKNRLILCSVFAVLFFAAAASQTKVAAQDDVVAGGYGDTATDDKDAVKAAAFAIKSESQKTGKRIRLVKILKAEVQVVAGLNFRVCMTVKTGRRKPKTETATVVVYRNLKNVLSLSRWKYGECTDL
jgi:hypothetical protein